MMLPNIGKNAGQSAEFEWRMCRDRHVMRQPHVADGLPRYFVAQPAQRLR